MTPAMTSVIDRILEHEGGIADVGDGKGITRFGQTPQWLDDNGFVPPANAADAAANYEAWLLKTGLAAVIEADPLAGYFVADFAVHSGVGAAVKSLQRALGVTADGSIGPVTLAALANHRKGLAQRVLSQRTRFIGTLLASTSPDRRQWARGWCNRLADLIETLP